MNSTDSDYQKRLEEEYQVFNAQEEIHDLPPIAHHILHHVTSLEELFERIQRTMHNSSVFLVADMIDRNGHMRWPETLVVVERLWDQLQLHHKYNHNFKRHEENFINFDCAIEGFEGIRAQDTLPLLIESFCFEEFIYWGGIVDVFVSRSFGPNFDIYDHVDTGFIDYAYDIETKLLNQGIIKPTQALARLRKLDVSVNKIDIQKYARLHAPEVMPAIGYIKYEFPVRYHEIHQDAQIFDDGFHPAEDDGNWHWTKKKFSFNLQSPQREEVYSCRLIFDFWIPETTSQSGAKVFINQILAGNIDRIFDRSENGFQRVFEFETLGGPLQVTIQLDEPFKLPDEQDQRELGIIVKSVGLEAARH